MVVDTSALIAILLNEPEAHQFAEAMAADPKRLLSAVSALETAIVIEARKGLGGGREFDLLIHRSRIELIPFTPDHAERARVAYQKFGKGRHAANLNFGECCSYALSQATGEPLLYKGEDFTHTDVRAVS
jgi:ribonuclease VapC